MNVLIVVPTRLESSRFPNKPLYKIAGREMILRVLGRLPDYEKIVATPNYPIAEVVTKNGYNVFITRREASCGTDRLVELSESIYADIYVNVQGDEPLISQSTVDKIVQAKIDNPDRVVCGMCNLDTSADCVKVIIENGRPSLSRKIYKQVGIYAFNRADLREFERSGEARESIEITRLSSDRLLFVEVDDTQAVDRLEDIAKVERILWQNK